MRNLPPTDQTTLIMPPTNSNDGQSSLEADDSSSRRRQDWSLENSSFWWLAELSPTAVLLGSSVPLLGGAFLGFRKAQTLKLVKEDESASGSSAATKSSNLSQVERRQLGIRTAARALRIATLTSVGTFGMIGAVWFWWSGYATIDEALHRTQQSAQSYRRSFEQFWGLTAPPSSQIPEVVATKEMTEDEELDYLYRKYIEPAELEEQNENTTTENQNETD